MSTGIIANSYSKVPHGGNRKILFSVREPWSKRVLDVALSSFGLVLLAPVWALIVIAIWLEDGRPIYHRQQRSGKLGRIFLSWKFRSMKHTVGTCVAVDLENDNRVTQVGRFLRATAMDELPQPINIFVGDMSFVGPRALMPIVEDAEAAQYKCLEEIPGFWFRSQVRPGLTGVAQVYAPKDCPRRNKFRYDAIYVCRMGLLLDIRLILVSIWITLRGKWESRVFKLGGTR